MRRELAITLLVILGLPRGLQQETENVDQIQETRELKTGEQHCPTWFVPQSNHTDDCKCGPQMVAVKCDEHSNQSMVRLGSCLTYSYSTGVQVAGGCPYNSLKADFQDMYATLPQNISLLNEFMCGGLDRAGVLCSHCKEGLGIPVFSYTFHCLPCLESLGGWLLYLFLAVFPTTIFFLIVIIFEIRVTSAPMNAFIFACQVIPVLISYEPYAYLNVSPFIRIITIVLYTLYGFWNLDFFRYVIPAFCISVHLTPIQVLALEYIVAFYPLLLIATTYIGVELYARDYKLIVWLWRPFSRCLAFVLRGKELNFSLVHAFSSFLLLSYSKILFVSFQLLTPTTLKDPKGQVVGPTQSMYYDASIGFFSAQHLPFALLAILALCIIVVLPALVLLLYPTSIFQKSLGCYRVRWLALHAFADTFNGYYKNGTEGTRDYRYFAGLYLMFRILPVLSISWMIIFKSNWMIEILSYALVSLLFALLRPYKDNWINIWDSVLFGLISFSFVWVMYAEYIASLPVEVLGVISTVPLIYIVVFVVHRYRNAFRNCCAFLNRYRANPPFEPDRLINPEECGQRLPSADCWESEHSNSATLGSRDETYPAACGNSVQGYGSVQ